LPGAAVASGAALLLLSGCFGGDSPEKNVPPPKLTFSRTAQIATVRPDGTGLRVRGPASNFAQAPAPVWSPSGAEIAFAFQRCSACKSRLIALGRGGGTRALHDAVGGDPSWSPDGLRLAYTHKDEEDRELIVLTLASGATNEPATAENASHPSWFPSGRSIVFAAEVNERLQLFRVAPDGTGERQLTTSGFYDDPAVSPDGKQLAFACLSEAVTWDLCLSDAHGGGIRRIVRLPGNERGPSFSPDGKRLVFSGDHGSRGGERALYVLNLGSGAVSRITPTTLDAGEPDWSPNGKAIVFALRRLVPVSAG